MKILNLFGLFNDKRKLILLSVLLLAVGFLATSVIGYFVSKRAIRESIAENELPVTADNVYSEIQKDLIRPIVVSSMMAGNAFVRDWILDGEKDAAVITKYLREVKQRYNALTSFLVSDRTRNYYYAGGILKQVKESEWRDAWYFRARTMEQPYEINVDPDLANKDAMTIFVNYRVFDYDSGYIGATGIGLAVDTVKKMVNDYEKRYGRSIYFVDRNGKIVLAPNLSSLGDADIRAKEGLSGLADQILKQGSGSFVYDGKGQTYMLNVRYIPELSWFLFVEKSESEAISGIKKTLFLNVLISVVVSLLIMVAFAMTVNRFQSRLEELATTDKLTGLNNRHAFDILMRQLHAEYKRTGKPYSLILFDIDHFKTVNDRYGHPTGDQVLSDIAGISKAKLRDSDVLCRWGGEEFLAALKGCLLNDAVRVAEDIRTAVSQRETGYKDQRIPVTVSLGAAQVRPDDSIDELLRRADQALYNAKQSGRNQTIGAA